MVAAMVVAIVAMMIVPLPTWLLDILITSNLALSVAILLAAVYARDALAIATFPTLLVLTTLFRLALNISTTRLILLQADAGRVVNAFGSFVVRGDYVVGGAVFLILTIVQYVVIARGAERVAEVAARFTLDAMPGKQLAIDSDLRSGVIDAEEARRRRRSLGREAQLYGALDGAMRFVKGDAVAGILILVISLIGGLAIGTLRNGMPLGDAAQLYTLLTIGDGLVSQLPAVLISTAAGLVVTRVAGDKEDSLLGADMVKQLLGRPRSLLAVALLLAVLAVVPGLPLIPFLLVALVFAAGATVAFSRGSSPEPAAALEPHLAPTLELAVDAQLARSAPDLANAVDEAARAIVDDLGLTMPPITCTTDAALPARSYEVRLRGIPLGEGTIPDGQLLAEAGHHRLGAAGIVAEETNHPGHGGPASWIAASAAPATQAYGIRLLDAKACLVTALDGTLRRYAHELLGIDETQHLLDSLGRTHPALVREVVPRRVELPTLCEILKRLLAEGVPIRDLRQILATLAIIPEGERDPVLLTERVRVALRRHITRRLSQHKHIGVLTLDPLVEEAVRDSIRPAKSGQVLALEPALASDILASLDKVLADREGARPAIVTSSELRRHVRRLVESDHPEIAVITYQELDPEIRVEPVGRLAV